MLGDVKEMGRPLTTGEREREKEREKERERERDPSRCGGNICAPGNKRIGKPQVDGRTCGDKTARGRP